MTATAPADTEVRRRILSAAVDLFADHGYDATSVSQVITGAAKVCPTRATRVPNSLLAAGSEIVWEFERSPNLLAFLLQQCLG